MVSQLLERISMLLSPASELPTFDLEPATARRAHQPAWALVAHPDMHTATAICAILRAYLLTPIHVCEGEAALAAIAVNGPPEIAVVDVGLPRLDGISVIAEIRRCSPHDRRPIVAVTGCSVLYERVRSAVSALAISAVVSPTQAGEELDCAIALALGEIDDEPSKALAHPIFQFASGALRDELAAIARNCGVENVLLAVSASNEQSFHAHFGSAGALLEADPLMCQHRTEGAEHMPLVVRSAFESPLLGEHPHVTSGLVGSYVGVPVRTRSGHVIGTLSVIDRLPWLGSPEHVAALSGYADRLGSMICVEPTATTSRQNVSVSSTRRGTTLSPTLAKATAA